MNVYSIRFTAKSMICMILCILSMMSFKESSAGPLFNAASHPPAYMDAQEMFDNPETKLALPRNHWGCILFLGDGVKCWGRAEKGQSGQKVKHQNLGAENSLDWAIGDAPGELGENLTFIDFGDLEGEPIQIDNGETFGCVLTDQHEIRCWGYDANGAMGNGNTFNLMANNSTNVFLGDDFVPLQLSVGTQHACALGTNRKIKCWGNNRKGELGLGDMKARGLNLTEMGNNLPYVDVGDQGGGIKSISSRTEGVCVLFNDKRVKCWGYNHRGQCGLGDMTNRFWPEHMGNNLPFLEFGDDFGDVEELHCTGTGHHCCVLNAERRMKCWGANYKGQLGLMIGKDMGELSGQMGDDLPYVDVGSNFTIWKVSLGLDHMCALSTENRVKCWGSNEKGQSGTMLTYNAGAKNKAMGDGLPELDLGDDFVPIEIAAGYWFSCARAANNDMKCWGNNWQGTLAIGSTWWWEPADQPYIGRAVGTMGNNLSYAQIVIPTESPTADPTSTPSSAPSVAPNQSPSNPPTPGPTDTPRPTPPRTQYVAAAEGDELSAEIVYALYVVGGLLGILVIVGAVILCRCWYRKDPTFNRVVSRMLSTTNSADDLARADIENPSGFPSEYKVEGTKSDPQTRTNLDTADTDKDGAVVVTGFDVEDIQNSAQHGNTSEIDEGADNNVTYLDVEESRNEADDAKMDTVEFDEGGKVTYQADGNDTDDDDVMKTVGPNTTDLVDGMNGVQVTYAGDEAESDDDEQGTKTTKTNVAQKTNTSEKQTNADTVDLVVGNDGVVYVSPGDI